jgi:hypothetical protein
MIEVKSKENPKNFVSALTYTGLFSPSKENLIDFVECLISHPTAIAATTHTAGANIRCNLIIAHEK